MSTEEFNWEEADEGRAPQKLQQARITIADHACRECAECGCDCPGQCDWECRCHPDYDAG